MQSESNAESASPDIITSLNVPNTVTLTDIPNTVTLTDIPNTVTLTDIPNTVTSPDKVTLTDTEVDQLQNYFQYSVYRDAINTAVTAAEQIPTVESELNTDSNLEHESDSESDIRVLIGK